MLPGRPVLRGLRRSMRIQRYRSYLTCRTQDLEKDSWTHMNNISKKNERAEHVDPNVTYA